MEVQYPGVFWPISLINLLFNVVSIRVLENRQQGGERKITKGVGRRDQNHFIKICQRHKIGKKFLELQEILTVKKLHSA